jgi:hypothetical protein
VSRLSRNRSCSTAVMRSAARTWIGCNGSRRRRAPSRASVRLLSEYLHRLSGDAEETRAHGDSG